MSARPCIQEDILTDAYAGTCSLCGHSSIFIRKHNSLREGYSCENCRASLRYRGQAALIVQLYGNSNTTCFESLSKEPEFKTLKIYEPGISGPFRRCFRDHINYQTSFFWPDIEPGETRDGVRCESLENLTFTDQSFDLIISSDILEHVRRPMKAFEEIYRVLKTGGIHVFSIPIQMPMRLKSDMRVDTSTDDDILLEPAHFHGDGKGGKSLVYVDYGIDLIEKLMRIGCLVTVCRPTDDNPEAQRLVTFAATRI